MLKIKSDFSTSVFCFVFLACIFCCDANLNLENIYSNTTYADIIKLERFKYDLFSPKAIKGFEFLTQKNLKCLQELSKIGIVLGRKKEWALKIVDSWGKLPSAFFEGNLNELGGFSECLSIKKDDQLYDTKYCLGEISLDKQENLKSSYRSIHLDNGIFPNIWTSPHDDEHEEHIESRALAPPSGVPPFKFAMCVPAVCSLDFLETIKLLRTNFTKRIRFPESSCQDRNTGSELRTLDYVSIVLLIIVVILIVLSTGYDIYYTVYDYEKSQTALAFSLLTNGKKVLSYKKSKSTETMHCLNGIRVISTQWVVLGHSFVMFAMVPLRNTVAIPAFFKKYQNMFLMSAPISVDTFFVLSGLLISMNLLKHLKKSNGFLRNLYQIPMIYVHRYLRLTPLLIAVVLFSITLLRFFGSGPLWPMLTNTISNQCEKYWWSTLLYIQNYENPTEICLTHTWYLSVDMQLFLIAPFIILLFNWSSIITILVLIAMICGSFAWTIIVHVDYGLKSILSPDKFKISYVPTQFRANPWLIGIIAGYFFLKYQNRSIRIPRLLNLFAWAVSLLVMVTVIFINYPLVQTDTKIKPFVFGLYDGLSRISWSIALCYIIFACVHNSGGPVNWFLSHPLWQPLGRISYATYLVHFPLIVLMMVTTKTSLYFTELIAFHTFIGSYVLSLAAALIATLAFESPIVILEKLLFKSKKQPSNSTNGTATAPTYTRTDSEPSQPNLSYRF